MGGNILANLAGIEGNNCFLEAICCVCTPMKIIESGKHIESTNNGFYNKVLGKNLNKLILTHEPILRDHFLKTLKIDIKQTIAEKPDDALFFDSAITAPSFGFKDRDEYYDKSSCIHNIPNIKKPTLIINSLDDPVCGSKTIDYEVIA